MAALLPWLSGTVFPIIQEAMTMMKKGLYAILTALTVFALVMTGCDTGGGPTTPTTPPSKDVTLNYVKLASGGNATAGGPGATLTAVTDIADVSVSKEEKTKAEITLGLGYNFKGTAKIALKQGTITEGDFTINYNPNAKPKEDVDDDYNLYVKLTAPSGAVAYYGFIVGVGTDASIKELAFTNTYIVPGKPAAGTTPAIPDQTVTEKQVVDNLGTPVNLAATAPAPSNVAEPGKIQFTIKQPVTGFGIEISMNDGLAEATISKSLDMSSPIIPNTDKVTLNDAGDAIYIKVISENKKKVNYYKIDTFGLKAIDIPYGTPSEFDVSKTLAAEWTTKATDWVYINRSNPAEGTGYLDLPESDRSFGRAKLMWDEDGVWIYAEVWEQNVSATAGSGSNSHTASSVELFINEAYDAMLTDSTAFPNGVSGAVTGSAKNGGQYRVGANGEASGAPTTPAVDTFQALKRFSAVKFDNVTPPTDYPAANRPTNSINKGYKVLFQGPWLYTDLYPLKANKKISLELQINATGSDGTRAGVLNWNNITSNSYSDLKGFGEGALTGFPATGLKPQRPIITAQPSNVKVDIGATNIPALSVTATSPDGGTLAYQWYEAEDATAEGTVVTGANNASYTPTVDTSEEAEFFFYVVVTNKNTAGVSSTPVPSNRAKFSVVNPDNQIYTLELVKNNNEKWDATEKALVIDVTSQYQDLVTFDISSVDVSNYARIEIVHDSYYPKAGENEGDPVVNTKVPYSQYGNVIITNIGGDNFGYNSSGTLSNGNYYTLTATHAAGTNIKLQSKYGGNGNPYPVNKIIIRSIKLVAKEPAIHHLDLSKVITTGIATSGQGTRPDTYPGYDAATGITWKFSASDQRGFIGITETQQEKLLEADYFSITITATMTDKDGTAMTSGGPNFRYFICKYNTGDSFNATDSPGDNNLFTTIAKKDIKWLDGRQTADRMVSFLFQTRSAPAADVGPVTVKITDISIEVIKYIN